MPTVQKPKAGGVIPENLNPEDFKRTPAQDRLCAKCKTVPHNPQRSECCNELYCFTCSLEDLICLTHRQRIVFAADKKFKTNMSKWNIKCPNWRTGCTFEDTISKVYKQHLPECKREGEGGREGRREGGKKRGRGERRERERERKGRREKTSLTMSSSSRYWRSSYSYS